MGTKTQQQKPMVYKGRAGKQGRKQKSKKRMTEKEIIKEKNQEVKRKTERTGNDYKIKRYKKNSKKKSG